MKVRLMNYGGKLRDPQDQRDMWQHLRTVHDTTVYIGNVFEIHDEDYPDCEYDLPKGGTP